MFQVIRYSSPTSAGAECIDPNCTWVEQWYVTENLNSPQCICNFNLFKGIEYVALSNCLHWHSTTIKIYMVLFNHNMTKNSLFLEPGVCAETASLPF